MCPSFQTHQFLVCVSTQEAIQQQALPQCSRDHWPILGVSQHRAQAGDSWHQRRTQRRTNPAEGVQELDKKKNEKTLADKNQS